MSDHLDNSHAAHGSVHGIPSSARAEWARHFMLPFAGAVGYATGVLHLYGIGAYLEPIGLSLGWTRVQTTFGLTLALLINGLLSIPMGMLIDRYGPRLFALIGTLLMCGGFALLSVTTGELTNWYLLWALLGVLSLPTQAIVWTRAVAGSFEYSRGLALAVTMCGASLAAGFFPLLATWLIALNGWRTAMLWHSAVWAFFAFPFLFFFLRPGKTSVTQPAGPEGQLEPRGTLLEEMRSSVYLRLIVATAFFGLSVTSLVVHFVPILVSRGNDPMQAAGVASVVGVAAIAGRLGTGFLLDRMQPRLVGAIAFLLPITGCAMLLTDSASMLIPIVAAASVGLTLGAEVDVLAYLTTRHFGLHRFGALFGGQIMAVALGTSFGPLLASVSYDHFGDYRSFLCMVIFAMIVSSLCVGSLPRLARRD